MRSMSDIKKKYISHKEAYKRPIILSKHTEYNPDGETRHKDANKKDKSNSANEKELASTVSKQPTILIKAREDPQRSISPKRNQNKENESGNIQKIITTPTDNPNNLLLNRMKTSIKLIDSHLEFNIQALDYLVENQNDFLVVGVLGSQGVGKSTLLNLIANSNTNNLVGRIVNGVNNSAPNYAVVQSKMEGSSESKSSSDIYSECSDLISSTSDKYSSHPTNASHNIDMLFKKTSEISLNDNLKSSKIGINKNDCMNFDIETNERLKLGLHGTDGIDMFITSNRVILLDTQPLLSASIMDTSMISSESKTMTHEVAAEIESLYLASFLLATCHIVMVVQDWFFDSNIIRLLNTANMLRPQSASATNMQAAEENIHELFRAHVLLIHNKAQLYDFSDEMINHYAKVYDMLFNDSSKLKVRSGLTFIYDKKIDKVKNNSTNFEKKQGVNLFIFPEITPDHANQHVYKGHDNVDSIVKRLRQIILGASRSQIAPSVTSEKHWGHNAHKTWEAIKKSGLFVEYCRMLH